MAGNDAQNIERCAPFGFFSFKDNGAMVSVNAEFCENLHYELSETEGKTVEQFLTLASRIFYQTHIFPLLKLHGAAREMFLTLKTKHNEELPVLLNARRMQVDDTVVNVCAYIIVYQRRKYEDEIIAAKKQAEKALEENVALITAKRELEINKESLDKHISKLEQNNQELMQLNQIISHDMQEPIRKISLFTDFLEKENASSLGASGQKAIERIRSAAEKILQLMYNLQMYVSIGMYDPARSRVNITGMIKRVFHSLIQSDACPGMKLNMETLPDIEGDEKQLELLFTNLIENAIKFCSPERPLVIRVTSSLIQHNHFKSIKDKFKYSDFVKLDLRDNGIGFDNKYNEYVFKILKKINANTPGLGFGLALCKKVVDNHYGDITASSEPGKGTRITILFPLKQ